VNGEVPPWPVIALGGEVGSGKLRQKIILTREQVHQVLGLPGNVDVVEMHVYPERLWKPGDPVTLHVAFEGPGLPVDWRLPR
jgi:hypothetical protein